MRDRVDLHGGALPHAPRPRGGYRVRAVLPVSACTDARPRDHVTAADPSERS
jgi:hypothetical protein